MKKQAKLIISTLLLFSFLSGCNSNSSTSTSTVPTTTNPSTSDPSSSSDVPVTGLSLDKESITVDIDEGFSLTATITPEDATDKTISWSSSNNKVELSATSGSTITVTAKDGGSSTITASCGNLTATCVVTINEEPPAASKIQIFPHDECQLIDSVEEYVDGNYVTVTDTGIEEGDPFYRVNIGANVRIHLVENGYFSPIGLTINGDDFDMDLNNYVIFAAQSDDYDFIAITPYYNDYSPSTGTISFDVVNTEHLTAKVYDSNKLRHEITSADPSDVVYIKVFSSNERYFARNMTYKRYSDSISEYKGDASYDPNKDLFYFTVQTSSTNSIKIEMVEGDNSLLADTNIPGTYLYFWLTSGTHTYSADKGFQNNMKITIANDGSMVRTFGDDVSPNRSDLITSYDDKTFSTSSYGTIPYGENWFFTTDYYSNGFSSPTFNNYDILAVKKESPSDYDAYYTAAGEVFVLNGNKYALLRAYRSGVEYINFLIDYTNKKIMTGLTIDIYYGNEINDDKVIYEVKQGTEVLLSVSYLDGGGYSNRIPLVSPYGVYTGSNGQFVLANDIVGVYGGVSYVAVIDGNQVTLKSSTKRIVLEIDKSNSTYTVISDEDITSSIPDLKNKVFSGFYHQDETATEYEINSTLKFTFNNYDSNDDIKVTFSGYGSYSATFTVDYDLDTNVITMILINSSQSYSWITNDYQFTALMSDGKMKMLENFKYALNFKNFELTCPDFHL